MKQLKKRIPVVADVADGLQFASSDVPHVRGGGVVRLPPKPLQVFVVPPVGTQDRPKSPDHSLRKHIWIRVSYHAAT